MSKTTAQNLALGLAVLIVIVVIATAKARSGASMIGCEQYLTRLQQGVLAQARAHQGQLPTSLQELVPHQVPHVPRCPTSDRPYLYEVEQDHFKISCGGSHLGLQPGNPYVEGSAPRAPSTTATP